MGVKKKDIWGEAPAVGPATPGSYGEAPDGFQLPAGTEPGSVTLQVADLKRSLDFYHATLGLAELGRESGVAVLGVGRHRLLEWSLELPDAADLDAAAASLTGSGFSVLGVAAGIRTRDPWGTPLRLSVADRGAR